MWVWLSQQNRLKVLVGVELVLLGGLELLLVASEPARRPLRDMILTVAARWDHWQMERWWRVQRARDPLLGKPLRGITSVSGGVPTFEVLALGDAAATTLHAADRYLSERLSQPGTAPVVLIVRGDQGVVQRVRMRLQRYQVPIYADTTGELHKQLNVFFVPRWYLFLRDGTLVQKQETLSLLAGCSCRSQEVR